MSCKFVYIIFVLFGLMASAYAQPAEVPKTGQTQTFSPGDDGKDGEQEDQLTAAWIARLRVGPEGQEGLRAFLNKEAPAWRQLQQAANDSKQ